MKKPIAKNLKHKRYKRPAISAAEQQKRENRLMAELEEKIDYKFTNKEYLRTALTHSSYSNEMRKVQDNERLEFLGDSVLSLSVSNYLYKTSVKMEEGDLTKIRSQVVCEEALKNLAHKINLGKYLRLGKGERQNGGANRDSILADATEAVIAAIYLDSGFEEASRFVLRFLSDTMEKSLMGENFKDYKSYLQEIVQQHKGNTLRYETISDFGPDHDKVFVVQVYCNDKPIGQGKGPSKKQAQQNAAKEAIRKMKK